MTYNNSPLDNNRHYITQAMAQPILEREEEEKLATSWRDHQDEKSLHLLIKAYARLVIKIASTFRGYHLPLEDLIQEGNVGIMEAAKRFDPKREVRFSTYAAWWIYASIQDFVLKNTSLVRLTTTAAQKKLFFNLRRLRSELRSHSGDDPLARLTIEEREIIAEKLSVTPNAVAMMESYLSFPDQSLNHVPFGEEGGEEWQDSLVDQRPNPEEVVTQKVDHQLMKKWIKAAFDKLSEREKAVIAYRFFKDDKITLLDIGKRFGVTKERIRQIEAKALAKLKKNLLDMLPINMNPVELLEGY